MVMRRRALYKEVLEIDNEKWKNVLAKLVNILYFFIYVKLIIQSPHPLMLCPAQHCV